MLQVWDEGEGPQESSEAQPPSRDMSFVPPDDIRASRALCSRSCCLDGAAAGLSAHADAGAAGASGWLDIHVALMEMRCCRPAFCMRIVLRAFSRGGIEVGTAIRDL